MFNIICQRFFAFYQLKFYKFALGNVKGKNIEEPFFRR